MNHSPDSDTSRCEIVGNSKVKTASEFSLIMTVSGMIIVTGGIKLLAKYSGRDYSFILNNKFYWIGLFAGCLGLSILAHYWHIVYPKFVKRVDEADTVRRTRGNCYYYIDPATGIEEGPLGISQLRPLIAAGTITPRTLVRKALSPKSDLRPAKHFRDITELGRQYGESREST